MSAAFNVLSAAEREREQERQRAFDALMWDIVQRNTRIYGPNKRIYGPKKPLLVPSEKPQ